ncbi:MAG: ABC transporter ATP-binding protein [Burkholderiaceae bacterium]
MSGATSATPLLEVSGLVAHYGDFQALFGIDFTLQPGEIVAIIGANGAGKSTLLRTLTGLNACEPGAVRLDGCPIGGRAPYDIVRQGIAMVPEGRRLFPSLSVRDNLLMGARVGRKGPWTLQAVQALFPILAERGAQPSTTLSGGQQQMVAISRALMSNPRVPLCDELSLDLAPTVIKDIYAAMPRCWPMVARW